MWSCGVVFYVMAIKEYPFMHMTDKESERDDKMRQHIIRGERYPYERFETT